MRYATGQVPALEVANHLSVSRGVGATVGVLRSGAGRASGNRRNNGYQRPSAPALAAIPVPPIDSAALRRRRLRLIVGGTAWGYGVIYTGLTTAWYTGERVPLHWLNDLPEWQQLDKCGHF